MHNVELAKRTQGFYIEDPHHLLTVTPTDFQPKPHFNNNSNSIYAIYHKTTCDTISQKFYPNNSSDQLLGVLTPRASHSNSPATDFFGVSNESGAMSLNSWSMGTVTSGLYKIGKNPLPAGFIGIFRCCPQMQRHGAGGNDQLQRGCKGSSWHARNCCTFELRCIVAFVAATQPVPSGSITWEYKSTSLHWILPKKPKLKLTTFEPALRYLCTTFFTSFRRTPCLEGAMLLYLVLTLEGISHEAIKEAL